MKISKYNINKVEKLSGFAISNAKPGERFEALIKASMTSDEERFYKYIDQISRIILNKIPVNINCIYQFLVLLHGDLSADVYINDFPVIIEMNAKKNIKQGEFIKYSDIANISKLFLYDIEIKDTDNVIFCFKVGWKFGLYFDFERSITTNKALDINQISLELGSLYRYLLFQDVYKILESKDRFSEILLDGWFPFIELIGNEFVLISEIYENRFELNSRIKSLVEKFDSNRLKSITDKWWSKPLFKEKEPILQAGVNAFLRDNNEGYILCIKTLLPEIEGVMKIQHFVDKGVDTNKSKILIDHLTEIANIKIQSPSSLFCTQHFNEYLQKIIFPSFDLAIGKIDLSRHTSSHGLAKPEQYTKIRALQMILILDQIYFYL